MEEENKSWVQDVMGTFVASVLSELRMKNEDYLNKTGSRYVAGDPKGRKLSESGQSMVGIYFIDPTAKPIKKE